MRREQVIPSWSNPEKTHWASYGYCQRWMTYLYDPRKGLCFIIIMHFPFVSASGKTKVELRSLGNQLNKMRKMLLEEIRNVQRQSGVFCADDADNTADKPLNRTGLKILNEPNSPWSEQEIKDLFEKYSTGTHSWYKSQHIHTRQSRILKMFPALFIPLNYRLNIFLCIIQ